MQYNLTHYHAVIIDSGINFNHDYFVEKHSNIDAIKVVWNEDERAINVIDEQTDALGHGTAISSIIDRYTHEPILMINFTDSDDEIDTLLLIHTLQFVYEYVSGDILNLSLGVPNCEEKEQLYDICKKLTDKGFIIVSAFDNLGALSYPASFDCVIGVLTGELCFSVNDFEYFENDMDVSQILILNNDIILTMPILERLSNYLYEHQDCAVVSPLLYNKEGEIDITCARRRKDLYSFLVRTPLIRKLSWIHKRNKSEYILERKPIEDFNKPMEIDLPSGSCMLFEKEFFRKIGYFDPHTFLYFEEDIIWSKLQKTGKMVIMLPHLSCIHIGASSISKQPSKAMERRYFFSMLYYLKEYSGFRGFWPWGIRFIVKLFYKI